MPEEMRDRVMRVVSTVDWPDGGTIRARAGRRRARRVVAGCAAVVAVVAAVWTVGPPVGDGGPPRPADVVSAGGPGMLRAEDVGPGYRIGAWGSYDSTEGGRDADERVFEWPPAWLPACPTFTGAEPAGFRGHRGGSMVRADPAAGVPVTEIVMRFADVAAARAVLDEARGIAKTCATVDVDGRQRYTATVAADGFAGDDAVRLDTTGVGVEHATGGSVGIPSLTVYVLVRAGPVVILLTAGGAVDGAWLQGLAPAAARRLCTETVYC